MCAQSILYKTNNVCVFLGHSMEIKTCKIITLAVDLLIIDRLCQRLSKIYSHTSIYTYFRFSYVSEVCTITIK